MKDNNDSVLDKIPQSNGGHLYDGWANGEKGTIADYNGRSVYRFYRATINSQGNFVWDCINDEDAPIVAVGIVAFWLHHRKNDNRMATANFEWNDGKAIIDVFTLYTNYRLLQYREWHKNDPDSWRRDLTKEFYTEFIIPNETEINKQTEPLFDFITPSDQKLVRDVMKEYMLFLQDKRKTYFPDVAKTKSKKKRQGVRSVDIDKIGNHFKYSFDRKTHLPTMKILLEEPNSDKDLARIALLIYESKCFLNNDYRTFSKWYKDFCEIVGCTYHKSYAPSALNPIPENLNKNFSFL